MRTFRATIAYDGTAFAGWQMQAGERTVQGELEAALQPIEGRRVVVFAASRTDAGVHATGQVASFSLDSPIAVDALARALNARLPADVRVMRLEQASDTFNARFDARCKTYEYAFFTGEVLPPRLRHYVWHLPGPLDLEAMDRAAALLVGRHDFAAFQAAGSRVRSTERTILESRVVASGDARQVLYIVRGTGFLRHMVRTIAGTLAAVGRRRLAPEDMQHILESRDRRQAAATAPPHGLTLVEVLY